VLDGKYEIISQRDLSPRGTLFEATAPDGTAVHLAWYDLTTPEEEAAFERYRALLRQLRRCERAAIYDLVARPGAHYVAWRVPTLPRPAEEGELAEVRRILEVHGKRLEDAQVCAEGGKAKVYALAFEEAPRPAPPASSERPPQRSTRRPEALSPYLPGLVLALVGISLLVFSFDRFVSGELITVPEVRGAEVNGAAQKLYALGFNVAPVAFASQGRPGRVVEVHPPAGSQLRVGRTLTLRYALPPDQLAPVRVPDTRGQELGEAERLLTARGLNVGHVARIYSETQVDRVIGQSPPARATAPEGSDVALLVSRGPKGEETFLPNLVGLPLEEALALAERAGLEPEGVQLEPLSGAGGAGTVLAQNIAPYHPVAADRARLRLMVAGGEEGALVSTTGTPDFTGLPFEAAQRAAQRASLRLLEAARVSSPELPEGIVLQRPAPGDPLQGVVRVTLNVHPQPPKPLPLPTPVASVNRGEVRRARYVWLLEPGIPEQQATVTVTTLAGDEEVAMSRRVRGGERIEGVWLTDAPGPVTFSLTLNGVPYGEPVTVNP